MIKEIIMNYPLVSVIILSFMVTLVMTLVTKYFTDQKRMKELKAIQKACQIKLKDNKGNLEAQAKIQKEMFGCSMELMKYSMKPLMITFIPLIIFFWWVRGIFIETTLVSTWLWWYIGTSIASSIILRKLMDVA